MSNYAPFDAADYLDSDEAMAEYLEACLDDPNPDVFLSALSDVARVKGIGDIAKAAGLGRESLYKALTPGSHPRYDTVFKVIKALGLNISVSVVAAE